MADFECGVWYAPDWMDQYAVLWAPRGNCDHKPWICETIQGDLGRFSRDPEWEAKLTPVYEGPNP